MREGKITAPAAIGGMAMRLRQSPSRLLNIWRSNHKQPHIPRQFSKPEEGAYITGARDRSTTSPLRGNYSSQRAPRVSWSPPPAAREDYSSQQAARGVSAWGGEQNKPPPRAVR
ncbi:hypothetical protein KIL84_017833 [Mauremys mutica]|uniref:Uncharacterized protein n=1 Tax=Mauremys mutica TaxID=74926 RepID=A0A9D3X1X5_9SAUR|nr:hypothetical protein KIL84_017833 [Mauremys mutica]